MPWFLPCALRLNPTRLAQIPAHSGRAWKDDRVRKGALERQQPDRPTINARLMVTLNLESTDAYCSMAHTHGVRLRVPADRTWPSPVERERSVIGSPGKITMGLTTISRPWLADRIARLEDVAGSPHAARYNLLIVAFPSCIGHRTARGLATPAPAGLSDKTKRGAARRPCHDRLGQGLPAVVGRELRPCRHALLAGARLASPLESVRSADGPLQRGLQSVAAGRIAANVEPEPSFDVMISSPRCRLRMMLDDGKPETGSAFLAACRDTDPIEALGQPWQVLRCNAWAIVGNRQDKAGSATSCSGAWAISTPIRPPGLPYFKAF